MKSIFSTAIVLFFSISLMAQTANLKFNLEKGKTYRVKSTNEVTSAVNYNGMQQNSEVTNISIMSVKAVAIMADHFLAEVRIDSMATKISMPKMEMNSSKPGSMSSQNPSDVMGCVLNRLCKSVFQVKMSPDGKVIEITNINAVTAEVTSGIDSITGQTAPMLQSQIKQTVSEKSIKSMIEAVTAYMPGKEVKVGDKWNNSLSFSSGGMQMIATSNYKLKSLTGSQAEISSETTLEPSGSEPLDMGGMQMTFDVRGLGKNAATVDAKTGWIIKSTGKSHLQGNLNMKMQGNDMQMPIEIDATNTLVALP
jgi:hypothetical protein